MDQVIDRVRDRLYIDSRARSGGEVVAISGAPTGRKLDLVAKLHQRSILPAAIRVANGERLVAPLVIDLDPTSFCDLACPECISSGVLNKERFTTARLASLAAEMAAAGVKGVILIGGGEPLMHKGIGGVIRTLHAAGVRIGLVTNGTLIDRYVDELAEMVSWVRVSMDAATERTYDRFRPSGRKASVFLKIIDNMRLLASRKRGRLGYSFLLMQRLDAAGAVVESNYDELEMAGRLAHDVGCDYLEVKAMFDDDHFVLDQNRADVERVSEQIEAIRSRSYGDFHVLEAESWRSLRDGRGSTQPKGYANCLVAEMRTTITPSGVFPCAYHRGRERLAIGDVGETSLVDMWAKADLSAIRPDRDCRFECARHASNVELHGLRGCTPGERSPVPDYDPFF